MITIDGSQGEGGGQILRTALALSMVTRQPFRIEHIRANRPKPGLMRQHLTCIEAACAVCDGHADGDELGSRELVFTPGTVKGGSYSFAIGTAGSTTLVLQTVLPALMTASSASALSIGGGTHNMHAPSVHFLQRAFLPLIGRMGPPVDVRLERHGFYPAGGGRIGVSITPSAYLTPIELVEASPIVGRRAVATVAGLPVSIAQREIAVVRDRLGWDASELGVDILDDDHGPGNILSIEIQRDDLTEVFTGFGERRTSAESVAARAVGEARGYLLANVPVWHHLADQLMLPFALAGSGRFRTCDLSKHAETNAKVIELFLGPRVHHTRRDDGSVDVRILT